VLYSICFIVSLLLTMALIPPLMKAAQRFNLVDVPDARKIHVKIIPRVGGIAMSVGFIIPVLLWVPFSKPVIGLVIGALIIHLFGVWDDRNNLNYKTKFLGQFIGVLIAVLYGGIVIEYLPFYSYELLPTYVSIPLTIFILLGVTNAINLADGLDGLAGGMVLLSVVAVALLAYIANGREVALLSIVLIGCILGFLRYNTYPARLFMGDGGSQLLGFALGALVVMLTQQINTAMSPVVILLILGLPILDTLHVMVRRLISGYSPFLADNNHVHHKLLSFGFDHYEAVTIVYIVQALLVSSAYVLCYQSDALILGLYLTVGAVLLTALYYAEYSHWRLRDKTDTYKSYFIKRIYWLRETQLISIGAYWVIKLLVPLFLVLGALTPIEMPRDISTFALMLVSALLIAFFWRRCPSYFLEKATVYTTCALVVYLMHMHSWERASFDPLITIFFVLLAITLVVGVRFTGGNEFKTNPLDLLIIFIIVVVPNIPSLGFNDTVAADMVLKLVLLCYSAEFVLNRYERRWDIIRVGTIGSLFVLGLRGFV